jgi:hypothetical protein
MCYGFSLVKIEGTQVPCDIVANKTKSSYPGICFHNTSKSTLSILGHGVGFVEDNNFVRRTRICLAIRGYHLCSWCLTSKILDLLSYNSDASFVGCVEFENAILEVIWAMVGS